MSNSILPKQSQLTVLARDTGVSIMRLIANRHVIIIVIINQHPSPSSPVVASKPGNRKKELDGHGVT